MKHDMIKPCAKCPFRTDVAPYIRYERADEIIRSLCYAGQSFPCHETTDPVEDEDGESDLVATNDSQQCAGAMIMLEHMEQPTQLMRIAERLGMYDRARLDMSSPVFESDDKMYEHFDPEGM